jgi:hypothetical protein
MSGECGEALPLARLVAGVDATRPPPETPFGEANPSSCKSRPPLARVRHSIAAARKPVT